MKFRSLGRMFGLIAAIGTVTMIASCGGGHTIGYAYVVTSPSTTNATIFTYDVRNDTGDLWPGKTAGTVNPYAPSAISSVVTPDGQNLYVLFGATTNIQTGLPIANSSPSQVVHYGVQADTGNITPVDTQDTGGNEAIALAIDPSGSYLYALDSFGTGFNTGSPGPGDVTVWALQPSATSTSATPFGTMTAPACSAGGTIVPNGAGCSYPVGWGPRGVAQTVPAANGAFLFVTNSGNTQPATTSTTCYSTVSGFAVSSAGALTPLNLSAGSVGSCPGVPYPSNALPVEGTPWAVTTATTSSGGSPLVYISDKSNNNVYQFSVSVPNGQVALQSSYAVGNQPENLLVVSGAANAYFNLYVSNFADGTITPFTMAPSTGSLTQVAVPYTVGTRPTCMSVDPTGTYFYVTNYVSGSVSGFTVGGQSGTLTEIANSPILIGSSSTGVNTSFPTCISIMPNN